MGQFRDSADYRAWNDEMIRRHNPAAYYQSPLVRILEGFRLRAILRGLGRAQGRLRVLEMGCGFGFVLARIARAGAFGHIVGADLSRPSLARAGERLGPGADLILADAASPPFRPGAFDAVCITEVLEHVPDPVAVLVAAKTLLAPGGVLVVTAPNEQLINRLKSLLRRTGLWLLFFGKYEAADHMEDEWHLHAADLCALKGWIKGAGLEVRSLKRLPFGLLPIRYLAVAAPAGG